MTGRDIAIVHWVGRQRLAEAGQIARRFSMDERNTYRRLRGLARLGLIDHARIFHARPGVYTATRAGLRAAGLRLPPPRIDIRTYEHELAAGWVLIGLEREFGAAALVTEREVRSRDGGAPERPRYGVWLGAQRTRRGLHFPDLVVESGAAAALAIEVELTAKGRARLDSILGAYIRIRYIGGVRYYLAPAARPAVERAVERLRARDLFDLRTLEEPDG